jgi:hypothetical protein
MDLSRLHKALSTYEVAEHIFKVDNGKTLGEALALLQGANEEAGGPLSLKNALKNTPNARGKDPIVMGANPSKVGLHTAGDDKFKPKDGTKAFQTAADKVQRISRGLATEDQFPDHRTVNNGELGWIKRKPSADQLATVKKAALKCAAQRNENRFAVNETAMQILKAHSERKLQEATAAARTIVAHPLTGENSVKAALPKEFSGSRLADATVQRNVADAADVSIRMPNWDVKSSLPDEFRPKIEKTADRSFGAAAKSIQRPSDIDFKDQEAAQELPKATTTQAQDKTNDNRDPVWDVNLKSPKKPQQGFASVNGAI